MILAALFCNFTSLFKADLEVSPDDGAVIKMRKYIAIEEQFSGI